MPIQTYGYPDFFVLTFTRGKGPIRVGHPEWDTRKDEENQEKHGISFAKAQFAFADPRRVIAEDMSHSSNEKRHYCFGWVEGGVLTVRFTFRHDVIRIFGAGYWRKGRRIYERENQVHRRTPWRPQGRS